MKTFAPRIAESCKKLSPMIKLAVQLTVTATDVAAGRDDWLNSSVTRNQGMEPGPTANITTKRITSAMHTYDTQESVEYKYATHRPTEHRNMPPNPISSNVLRPAISTSSRLMIVITTFIAPIPSVAYCDCVCPNCTRVKISVEKNMTALIPENCCAIIITMAIMSG